MPIEAKLMKVSSESVKRLVAFFDAYAGLTGRSKSSGESLAIFFQRAAPMLSLVASEGPPLAIALPSAERMREVLHRLGPPIRTARGEGNFLNVWTEAGLKRSEIRNSAVLAWLLTPTASHGLGSTVIDALFQRIAARISSWSGLNAGSASVRVEEWPLGSEEDRVDISIEGRDYVMFIEIKINAPLGERQLERYVRAAQQKADALGVPRFRWRDIAKIIRDSVGKHSKNDNLGRVLARHYAQHIESLG